MVKRPPSNLPVSEAEDSPHKIDVDTVSISGENSSEVDNEADEFVNIVALPLIEGSDLNQTKGTPLRYLFTVFTLHCLRLSFGNRP